MGATRIRTVVAPGKQQAIGTASGLMPLDFGGQAKTCPPRECLSFVKGHPGYRLVRLVEAGVPPERRFRGSVSRGIAERVFVPELRSAIPIFLDEVSKLLV